ncbi:MAG: peptidoglycan-binding domain-containing protein [bacterium]
MTKNIFIKISTVALFIAILLISNTAKADSDLPPIIQGDSSSESAKDSPSTVNSDSGSNNTKDTASTIQSDSSSEGNSFDLSLILSDPASEINQNVPALIISDNGGNQDSTSTATTTDTTPTVPINTVTSSNHSSGGGGSSSRYFTNTNTAPTSTVPVINACPLITTYMSENANNNFADVVKLQLFLKNTEGLSVDVNGIYDTKTVKAVSAFQAKYLEDIMGPWGSKVPSGNVYITTEKKINEIVCKTSIALAKGDLGIISAYKSNTDKPVKTTTLIITPNTKSTSTIIKTGEIGKNKSTSTDDQSANASKTPAGSRIGNFFRSIYHVFF